MEEARFRRDLFKGTSEDYDRFRPPYPPALIADLIVRTGSTSGGHLLDLACGTGQISFAVQGHFEEVWAVDQEEEAVTFGRLKAERLAVSNIHWIAASAEDVQLDPAGFDLVAIGNAFHRLPRRVVAQRAFDWLTPGGHFALLWTAIPWLGASEWQHVASDVIERWMVNVGATDRVPADLDRMLQDDPREAGLSSAGFEIVGSFDFAIPYQWTVETLTGFLYSTSFLSRVALGDRVDGFATDLRMSLLAVEPSGQFDQALTFAYDLARRPELS